jgi:hypothetical protein
MRVAAAGSIAVLFEDATLPSGVTIVRDLRDPAQEAFANSLRGLFHWKLDTTDTRAYSLACPSINAQRWMTSTWKLLRSQSLQLSPRNPCLPVRKVLSSLLPTWRVRLLVAVCQRGTADPRAAKFAEEVAAATCGKLNAFKN